MANAIGFFRRGGKIIPIRAASGAARGAARGSRVAKIARVAKVAGQAGAAAAGANAARKSGIKNNKSIKVNKALDMTGLGLSVASGVIAAATFSGGWKSAATGVIASHAIDAAGIAANIASVAGRGHGKERTKQAVKQEARNLVVGNVVWAAGMIGLKRNRVAVAGYAAKILEFGRKAVKVARNI